MNKLLKVILLLKLLNFSEFYLFQGTDEWAHGQTYQAVKCFLQPFLKCNLIFAFDVNVASVVDLPNSLPLDTEEEKEEIRTSTNSHTKDNSSNRYHDQRIYQDSSTLFTMKSKQLQQQQEHRSQGFKPKDSINFQTGVTSASSGTISDHISANKIAEDVKNGLFQLPKDSNSQKASIQTFDR